MKSGKNILIKTQALILGLIFFFIAKSQNVTDTTKEEKKDSVTPLQEVVVTTAMGIKRLDKNIGYSVQAVSGASLVKARETNALSGLTGKVAGLNIGTSAEMLGQPQIVLRGNKDIMYVVDGVPVNSDGWNLSPDDVESYTVLKGPNAAALYGFRGQNGAIVITTKKGTHDPRGWNLDFNSSNVLESGFLVLPKAQTEYGRGNNYLYEFASGGSYTYGTTGTDSKYDNTQRLAVWGPHFDGQLIKQYDSPYDETTGVRTPTAWTSRGKNNLKNFMESGFLSTNNISATTSGDNYDLRFSYSHMFQKGMAPNTKLNIDNLAIGGNIRFSKKFSIDASLNLNVQYSANIPDVSYGPNSFVYELAVYGPADYDVRDLKDIWGGQLGVKNSMQNSENYGRSNNPYFQSKYWTRSHYKTDIYGYIRAMYKFNDDLDLSFRSQVSTWNQTRDEKVPVSAVLNDYLPTGWYTFGSYNGDLRQDKRYSIENNTDLILNYKKQVNEDWRVNAMLGGTMRSFKYNSDWATTQNLSIPWLYTLANSKGSIYAYNFNSSMMVWSGFYSFDLNYKKYFALNTTGRVDNLSTFASGHRTFFYPSVTLSSVVSDYIELPSAISSLKVRASYANVRSGLTQASIPTAYYMTTGKTTNSGLLGYGDELYSSYNGPSYGNQMNYSSVTYYDGTPAVSYSSTLSNKSIKPASNTSYEGGIDLRLLNNRITLSGTYFVSNAGPQIYAANVANSTTYSSQNINGVTTQKKGWELMLEAAPFKNPDGFNWNITVNWSTYKERLKSIYGSETGLTINSHTYKIGERMDAYYGTGFVRNQSGQIIYSGGLPMQNPSSSNDDKKFLGFMNPDFSFGINNSFSYRSFALSFQFDGRIGGKIFDRVYDQMTNGGTSQESVSGALGAARLAEWKSTNTGANSPTAAYVGDGVVVSSGTATYSKGVITNSSDLTFTPNTTAVTVQSFLSSGVSGGNIIDEYFMVSRSYAKLREVVLTYTLPQSLFKKKHIFKSATVSLVGRNLLYFAQRKDFDIDQYASGYNFSDNALSGTESTGLQSPTARRYGVNINLSF